VFYEMGVCCSRLIKDDTGNDPRPNTGTSSNDPILNTNTSVNGPPKEAGSSDNLPQEGGNIVRP
jgi:hypothetical protein